MTKKDKTPTESGPAFVTDIQHEEVKSNGELAQVARVMTPEETAQQEIKKFNLADSAIEILKAKYGSLTIAGPEDRAGYKAVRDAWGEIRSNRTGLEKKGKELRDGYTFITRKISAEEKRLLELIEPLETDLYKKWKAIDEEKERAENERKAAEEKEFMTRLETLQKFGMVLDGGFYSIGEAIQLDAATLRAMPEDRFLTLKGKAEAIFKDNAKKWAEAEFEKKRQADELQRQKEDFERQQNELKEQRAQMERDREAMETLRREQENQLEDLRVNKLLGLGMKRALTQLYFSVPMGGELSIIIDTLKEYSAEKFQAFFDEVTTQIKELKDLQATREAELEAAAKERERREKFVAEQMERAGLKYNYSQKRFEYKGELNVITVDWNFLLGMSDEEIIDEANKYVAEISTSQKQAAEQEKERQAQAEAERKAGMKDADLFAEQIGRVNNAAMDIASIAYKTKAYQNKALELHNAIKNALKPFDDWFFNTVTNKQKLK